MKKIKDSTIIVSALMNINREQIEINDLLIYIKKISNYLKKEGYIVNKIEKVNINTFFRMFPYIGIIIDNKIIMKQKITDKLKKFFFYNIDEKLINNVKNNTKYILPIIVGENLVNISFITDNNILEKCKSYFYYDSVKNMAYIIDLDVIKENCEYVNVLLLLEKILKKECVVDKEILNFKDINKLFELSYSIRNNEFKNIESSFNLSSEFNTISSLYEVLFYYCKNANNNKINLELMDGIKTLKKLIK